MDSVRETTKLSQSEKQSSNIDSNELNWICIVSKKVLGCYFEYFKEKDEERDDTVRSKPVEEKKLTCSPEEHQLLVPIAKEFTSLKQLCKCSKCLKMYDDQNVNFQFGIKNIESLPTEILLMIFKHLTPMDRRIASECCKRFMEIWLCDVRLVFDWCVLDPKREPLSTFLKSSRSYHSLALGIVEINEMSECFTKIGETITTLELKCYKPELFDVQEQSFFAQFPNLKKVKLSGAYLSKLPTELSNVLLVISNIFGDELNELKCYLDKTPDSFRIEPNITSSTKEILEFTESQRNKIQKVRLNLEATDSKFKLPRFDNLKHLELDFDNKCDYGTENVLDNLEEQCPALKDLSIDISNRLPHKNWTCLKTLTAWKIPKEELSRLSIFENLEDLTLPTKNKCFFVHKKFLNRNLKTLDIHSDPSNLCCSTCFQTMTKSFPDLENFTCYLRITNDHLEELATNTPKLKCLNLRYVDPLMSLACLPNLTELDVTEDLTPHMIETWPIMLQLRQIHIVLPHLNFETVKIFERMPALEDLALLCINFEGDQLALLEALTKPLKRLTKIRFDCGRMQYKIHPEIIDAMANNCKYLQKIYYKFYGPKLENEEIVPKLLQKHPSIRCINNIWLN